VHASSCCKSRGAFSRCTSQARIILAFDFHLGRSQSKNLLPTPGIIGDTEPCHCTSSLLLLAVRLHSVPSTTARCTPHSFVASVYIIYRGTFLYPKQASQSSGHNTQVTQTQPGQTRANSRNRLSPLVQVPDNSTLLPIRKDRPDSIRLSLYAVET
jgi:hypothetical protein